MEYLCRLVFLNQCIRCDHSFDVFIGNNVYWQDGSGGEVTCKNPISLSTYIGRVSAARHWDFGILAEQYNGLWYTKGCSNLDGSPCPEECSVEYSKTYQSLCQRWDICYLNDPREIKIIKCGPLSESPQHDPLKCFKLHLTFFSRKHESTTKQVSRRLMSLIDGNE